MNATITEYFEHKNTTLYKFQMNGINPTPGTLFIWNSNIYMNKDNSTCWLIKRKTSANSSN